MSADDPRTCEQKLAAIREYAEWTIANSGFAISRDIAQDILDLIGEES